VAEDVSPLIPIRQSEEVRHPPWPPFPIVKESEALEVTEIGEFETITRPAPPPPPHAPNPAPPPPPTITIRIDETLFGITQEQLDSAAVKVWTVYTVPVSVKELDVGVVHGAA
jgi:hypothetical protein